MRNRELERQIVAIISEYIGVGLDHEPAVRSLVNGILEAKASTSHPYRLLSLGERDNIRIWRDNLLARIDPTLETSSRQAHRP